MNFYIWFLVAILVVFVLVFLTRKKKLPLKTWNIDPEKYILRDSKEISKQIDTVSKKKQEWYDLSVEKKLNYLRQIKVNLISLTDEWATLCTKIRKTDKYPLFSTAGGVFGPGLFGLHLNKVIDTYESLAKTGHVPSAPKKREYKGQTILEVMPTTRFDKLVQVNSKGELWLHPGKPDSQGASLKDSPGVVAILGAGNFEAPTDILAQMFMNNKVVVYKAHPMNCAAVSPIFPRLFDSLIADNYLCLVSEEVSSGTAILNHKETDEWMLTGGCATFDTIVWGSKDPSEKAKRSKPILSKKCTAELGAVSPWIVVPGDWSSKQLKHHVQMLVSIKLANGSAICASPQVLILDKNWNLAETFVKDLKTEFSEYPEFEYYYVATRDRVEDIIKNKSETEKLEFLKEEAKLKEGKICPLLITNIDESSYVTKKEAFAPVLGIYLVDYKNDSKKEKYSVEKFLKEAVKFANSECFGSLSCTVIIDPATEKKNKEIFEDAIRDLKWGSIGINDWAGSVNLIPSLRWGAFPGAHSLENIGSGIGEIGNCLMYDHVQKSVLRRTFISPLHAVRPKAADSSKWTQFLHFSVDPSWGAFFSLLVASIRAK